MKISKKFVVVAICLTAMSAFAAAEIIYQTSGLSEFKFFKNTDDQRWVSTTQSNYDLYTDYAQSGEANYLLESQVTRSYSLDAEGVVGNASWKVRGGDRLQNVLWSKSENVSKVELVREWAIVTSSLEGCCAEMDGVRAFDVKTGRLILSYNDVTYQDKDALPFIFAVPNSSLSPRFVGLITLDSTRDQDFQTPFAGMANALLVKYAAQDGSVYQKVQIDTVVGAGWAVSVLDAHWEKDPAVANSDKIEITDGIANMWNIDGVTDPQKVEGLRLVLTINAGNGDKIIKIPVSKDRLSLGAAEIPSQVHIRAL
jgi:hypothetical protein